MKEPKRLKIFEKHHGTMPVNNENGYVVVLVLLIMAIMSTIAIISSKTVVKENFIVRNVAIRRQNVNLVESALMQGLQEFMQIDSSISGNFNPNIADDDWINPANAGAFAGLPSSPGWYETSFSQRALIDSNSRAVDDTATGMQILVERGETGLNNLRYALVGWTPSSNGGLSMNSGAVKQTGACVAEYVSLDDSNDDNGFGLMRMEIGLRRYMIP